MARVLRSSLLCFWVCVALFLLVLQDISPAQTAGNPAEAYVFGADSPITTDPDFQDNSAIDGNIVIWPDGRDGPNGERWQRIFFKDLNQPDQPEQPVVPDEFSGSYKWGQGYTDIGGGLVVWQQQVSTPTGGVGYQIFYSYLGSGALQALSPVSYTQIYPSVSGTRVVWQDERAGSWETDIYMYDLATGVETPVCTESSKQERPDIDGDWAVWVDNRGGTYVGGSPTKNDIYAKNVVTGEERRLTFDENDVVQGSPAISGNRIVYSGNYGGVWLYDLATGQTRQLSGEGGSPDINGDKVVWRTSAAGGANRQVWLYDLATETSQEVTTGTGQVYSPKISANNIVWTDDRNGNRDIYRNVLGDRAGALAARYRPELNFRHDINNGGRNDFEPRTVNLMADAAEKLVTNGGDIYNPSLQDMINNPAQDNYLDLSGSPANPFYDYIQDYKAQLQAQNYPLTAYSRVVPKAEGTDRTVIQYWLNYYYNNWYNNHEGDWEMVEVILNENLEAEAAAYSQHGSAFKKYWDEPGFEKTDDGRPKVYVAEGSHANYFYGGSMHFYDAATLWSLKDTTGSASWTTPAVDINGLAGGWADFEGFWGQKRPLLCPYPFCDDGPRGPVFQGDSWNLPLTWASSSGLKGNANDFITSAFSPVEIHLYDSQGNHVGKNAAGTVEMQIPGSEYFEREEDHSKNIVIRNADVTGNYRLEIEGSGEGTMDLKIQAPDFGGNQVDKNQYLTVPINPSTKGELNITPAKDYGLKLDQDNDGVFEEQRAPDFIETTGADFTPPAAATDLAVANTSSGTATLSWTAPGDDGTQGTVTRYDLRYATGPITEESWPYAKTAASPEPQPAGSAESAAVTGLDAGATYHFALKARDDAWQESPLSNVATTTTAIPNLNWSKQRVYWANWTDYTNRHLSIDYRMSNVGTGTAFTSTVRASFATPNTVYTVTPLPLLVGDINPGAYRTVTLKYYVPTNVSSFTATTYATGNDDAGRIYWFPGPLP